MSRIGYVRVSSVDQNTGRQLDGIELDKVFTDKASGKDTKRPEFEKLMVYLREGDHLIVHSMDRLSRNFIDLRMTVDTLVGRGVTIQFMKENMTFTNQSDALANCMLNMMGVFAEFERAQIRERQREGIAHARATGKSLGGRVLKLKPEQAKELETLYFENKAKVTDIAELFEITRQTTHRYIRAAKTRRELESVRALRTQAVV